jgi:hypothetical protein
MSLTKKRLLVAVLVIAVLGTLGGVALSQDGAGIIDRWTVKDESTEPTPVGYVSLMKVTDDDTIEAVERRRQRVRRFRVRNRSGPIHHRVNRGGRDVWYRTARGTVLGGNILIPDLVHATVSQKFYFSAPNGRIVKLGPLNLSQAVSGLGSAFLWHNKGTPYAVKGEGRTCDGDYCWDYRYRRGIFSWEQGWGPASREVNGCVSVTMRGSGQVVVGRPNC